MCKITVSKEDLKIKNLKELNTLSNLAVVYSNYALFYKADDDSFIARPLSIEGIATLNDVDSSVKMFDVYDNFVVVRTKRYYKKDKSTGELSFIDVKNGNNLFIFMKKDLYTKGIINKIISVENEYVISVGAAYLPIYAYISGVARSFAKSHTLSDIRKIIINYGLSSKNTPDRVAAEEKVRRIYQQRNGWCFDGFNLLISSSTSLSSLPETFRDLQYLILFKNESSNTPVLLVHDEYCKYKVIYVHDLENFSDVDIFKEGHTVSTFAKTYREYVEDLESGQNLLKLPITGNNTMYVGRSRLADLVKNHHESVYREGKAFVGEYSFTLSVFNKIVSTLQTFTPDTVRDFKVNAGLPVEDPIIDEEPVEEGASETNLIYTFKPIVESEIGEKLSNVILAAYLEDDEKLFFVSPNTLPETSMYTGKFRRHSKKISRHALMSLFYIDDESDVENIFEKKMHHSVLLCEGKKLHVFLDNTFAESAYENLSEINKYIKNGKMSRTIKDSYIQVFNFIIRTSDENAKEYNYLKNFTYPDYLKYWEEIEKGTSTATLDIEVNNNHEKVTQVNLFDTMEQEELPKAKEEIRREEKKGYVIEYGHTFEEYNEKFGKDYADGNLWDYSVKDFEDELNSPKLCELNTEVVFWYLKDKDGEFRYFETSIEAHPESSDKNAHVDGQNDEVKPQTHSRTLICDGCCLDLNDVSGYNRISFKSEGYVVVDVFVRNSGKATLCLTDEEYYALVNALK